MREMPPTDLAALLSARICHDLVSPVGAIVNGIDLIQELGTSGLEDEFSMISQSATRASGILQFYRMAFGVASADAESISRETLREQANSLITSPRITMSWSPPMGPALSRPEARLLCQILLCAKALTGMTGKIDVSLGDAGALPMVVTVHGDGSPETEHRLKLLTGRDEGVTSRSVEFALVRTTAGAMGLSVASDRQPGRTSIAVTA